MDSADYNTATISNASVVNDNEVDYAQLAIRLFICIAGILGNLMVIFVIVVLKEYKKAVTHWYVLQLAIADSIFLFTLPFKMVEDIENQWTYSSGMCKAKESILFLNYYASILFLVIMSVDRYVAVCHGFSDFLQKFRTHNAAYVITVVTWTVALILCIPVMLYSDKAGNQPNCICSYVFPKEQATLEEFCVGEGMNDTVEDFLLCKQIYLETQDQPICKSFNQTTDEDEDFDISDYYENYGNYGSNNGSGDGDADYTKEESGINQIGIPPSCHYWDQGRMWKGFLIFNFVCMFLLPFIIMTSCYTMIILKLQEAKVKRAKSIRSTSMSNSTGGMTSSSAKRQRSKSVASVKANSDRNRVTIMCAVLVFLFVACWLPFHSVHMAKIHGIALTQEQEKWCKLLPLVASMIAYMNSALNPYLYNFLGTRFGRRFRIAVTSVRMSVKSQASSVSSAAGVKYHHRRSHKGSTGEYSSSQGATATTKIYKGQKHSVNEHHSSVVHSTALNGKTDIETQPSKAITYNENEKCDVSQPDETVPLTQEIHSDLPPPYDTMNIDE